MLVYIRKISILWRLLWKYSLQFLRVFLFLILYFYWISPAYSKYSFQEKWWTEELERWHTHANLKLLDKEDLHFRKHWRVFCILFYFILLYIVYIVYTLFYCIYFIYCIFYFIVFFIVFSVSWGSVSFYKPGQPVTHGRLPTFTETLQFKIVELRPCRLDF